MRPVLDTRQAKQTAQENQNPAENDQADTGRELDAERDPCLSRQLLNSLQSGAVRLLEVWPKGQGALL
jgi:hypothetical protein